MSRGSPHWSADEDATLRRLFSVASWADLLRALPGRSRNAVTLRAFRLGLHRAVGRVDWTPRELAVLRELHPRGGAKAVQRALPHRSLAAIYEKASLLRVWAGGGDRWRPAEIAALRKLYPQGGAPAVQGALPHRSPSAIKRKAEKLRLRRTSRQRHTAAATVAPLAANHPGAGAGARRWTPAELEVLCEVWPAGGSRAAQRALPLRTPASIAKKALHEGLSRRKSANRDAGEQLAPAQPCQRSANTAPWSTVEIKTLRRVLPVGGIDAVRRLLPHRAPEAVRAQARVLQIPGADA